MLKFIYRTLPLVLVFLFAGVAPSRAQSLSAFFGVGTATDKSNGQISPNGDGTVSPSMAGSFGSFGAQFMLNSHLGVGGEYSFKFSQGNYSGFGYRPAFYDFNAIYQPIGKWSRVIPVLEGGIGGATVHYYLSQQFCAPNCSTVTQLINNSNHFAIHGAAGVRIYVTEHAFIRPQVDVRYIPNFVDFGSNFVPEYTVAIGYTFGGR